jgi:hypothetical protein
MKLIAIVSLIGLLATSAIVGMWWVSTSNSEIGLRNAMKQKQKDNENELAHNVQIKIKQAAQVTDAQTKALVDIIRGNSEARAEGTKGGGSLALLVREAVPNVDSSSKTFQQLINVITSAREGFVMRQKELMAMKTQHDNIRQKFPSSIVCGGRPEIEIVVVTSSQAAESFRTGKDDDNDVFKK